MLFKRLIPAFLFLTTTACSTLFAQTLYSKTYGKKTNPALIYMHGGPRGNATLFEGTTAQNLADKGFYVIVYDRRGEGRSADPRAQLTFNEAFEDLNSLIKQYGLQKVNIIGHSFGGLIATAYTDAFPKNVERLILVGALFSQQETYVHILDSSFVMARKKNDTAIQEEIKLIHTLDTASAEYRKKTYEVASHFGFFKMPKPTAQSKELELKYKNSIFSTNNIRNDQAPILFYQNEKLVNIDTKRYLKAIKKQGVRLAGIYGLQDGIFSKKQLNDIEGIIGRNSFYTIDNCSHYPFVDQQKSFISAIIKIMK